MRDPAMGMAASAMASAMRRSRDESTRALVSGRSSLVMLALALMAGFHTFCIPRMQIQEEPRDPDRFSNPDAWNGVRHGDSSARARRGHVESYFLKLNDREGRRALWLKATILARGSSRRPYAEPV